MKTLIKDALVVNEGKITSQDILLNGARIEKVASSISDAHARVLSAEGHYLLPGCIDDQVHFREPGLTHKGSIFSESRAAVAGGITSYMDMPNTIPNTLTQALLAEKYALAAQKSVANYSFFMGINQDNLEEALRTDPEQVCGITDDGLYFNNDHGILANYPEYLEQLFARCEILIALHSENDTIIRKNTDTFRGIYGDNIPFAAHPLIRSEEACVAATRVILDLAKKHQNRLHVFHVSTAAEAKMFANKTPLREKRITAEACTHHLWFTDADYERLGANIKWNPSIKSAQDRDGLLAALLDGSLDIIASDHAPHSIAEKQGNYFQSMSGGPLVQHSLLVMLELYHQGKISLPNIVAKMSHHVAEIYRMKERGYIREGYFADLVLVDVTKPTRVSASNTLYHCQWSPFENQVFQSRVMHTFVNGQLVYSDGKSLDHQAGMRLQFEKIR